MVHCHPHAGTGRGAQNERRWRIGKIISPRLASETCQHAISAGTAFRPKSGATLDLAGLLVVLTATHLFFNAAAFDQFAKAANRLLDRLAFAQRQFDHSFLLLLGTVSPGNSKLAQLPSLHQNMLVYSTVVAPVYPLSAKPGPSSGNPARPGRGGVVLGRLCGRGVRPTPNHPKTLLRLCLRSAHREAEFRPDRSATDPASSFETCSLPGENCMLK